MEFALLNDARDAVLRYPLDIGLFLRIAFGINYSSALDVEDITGGRVVEVVASTPPADSHLYTVVEIDPVFSDPDWVQTWDTVTLSAGEQAAKLALAKRNLWNEAEAKGREYRTASLALGSGFFEVTQENFSLVNFYAAQPGGRTIPLKKNADGIALYVTATAQEVASFVAAFKSYVDGIIANEYSIQQDIVAASDFTDLAAIDITAGWPSWP